MLTKIRKIAILSFCLVTTLSGYAQNADMAESDFSFYATAIRKGTSKQEAYEALLRSAREYLLIFSSNPSGSSARINAEEKLRQMIGPLQNAVMFFNSNGQTNTMMTAAFAYVDATSACPMVELSSSHIPIVRLVAINTANSVIKNEPTEESCQKVVPYLKIYIATNDNTPLNRLEQAYTQLGFCCTKIMDYAQAYKVLKQGLTRFPDNVNMPRLMVNALQHIGNRNDELIQYLHKALAIEPNDAGLLRILARQYQEMNDNVKAAEVLGKLHQAYPYQRDYTRNLAYSYFTIGLDLMDSCKTLKKKSAIKEAKANAEAHLKSASTLLEELMVDEFNENEQMKYTQALATIYAYIKETKKVEEMENKLKENGLQTVDARVALADLDDTNRNRKRIPTVPGQPDVPQPYINTPSSPVADVRNSDVDVELPLADVENPQNFVAIIANENYQEVEHVEFANNDGTKFKEYCVQTLGIPESHIKMFKDATLGQMKRTISWLRDGTRSYSNSNVIFYYAGHGMPDEKTKDTYLMPVDGTANDKETNYSVEKLYAELGALNCDRVCVFMDACFSGSKRGEGMISSSRGIAVATKKAEPKGKMVIFSAAQGDETAYPYRDKNHGLFTYYLLKKLKESSGNLTLGELADYLTTNVKKTSFEQNQKLQTPDVSPSINIRENWASCPLIYSSVDEK